MTEVLREIKVFTERGENVSQDKFLLDSREYLDDQLKKVNDCMRLIYPHCNFYYVLNEKLKYPDWQLMEKYKSVIGKYFGIEDLATKSQKRECVSARNIYVYLLRNNTDISLDWLGRSLGGKDHSTIIHCLRSFKNDYFIYDSFRQRVSEIVNILKAEGLLSVNYKIEEDLKK